MVSKQKQKLLEFSIKLTVWVLGLAGLQFLLGKENHFSLMLGQYRRAQHGVSLAL